MSRLEEQIDIDAPARKVWDRLHDVESYPAFMNGVQSAHAHGSNRAHLDVQTKSAQQEFEAVLSDRDDDQVIAWRTEGSPALKGDLTVRSLDQDHSQVQIRMEYEPEAIHDAFGGPRGMAQIHRIENTVRGDLEQLKNLVEGER
ncbi:SRPBCC family protein [Kitasatospora sp. NPDC052896]|uniref:SRPBCC family protein n=1 Tax=Kitasatospora sp. NPDC052896 TaxID=3364061 RepID=UPI0037CAE5BB